MTLPKRWLRYGLATSVLGLYACASAAPGGEAVRPKDPTAAGALGEEDAPGSGCTKVSTTARPFLADWKTDQRAELEAAMQSGIAVVHYACDGIRVLPDCKVKGSYAYAGIPPATEERVIEENSDLAGTIPLSAVSLSAEMSRGLKLRLKYALIGRKGSPNPEIARDDLHGSCEGATHFVRAALLGAFELGTATEGSMGGGAKVLGAGVEGHSRSAREMNRRAGDLGACKAGNDDKPPANCEHLVQLQLGPVVQTVSAVEDEAPADSEKSAAKAETAKSPCSDGYVLGADGACKKKSGAGAYLCDPKNADECSAQCSKGSAQSCHNAALAQFRKDAHPSYEKARDVARGFYEKGCDAGYAPSCNAFASIISFGKDADKPRARQLYERACTGGDAAGCLSLAMAAENPMLVDYPRSFTPQPPVAFKYTEKACKLGHPYACSQLAKRYIDGKGVLANVDEGLRTLQKQCEAGNAYTCNEWAGYLAGGKSGIKKDTKKALELYRAACEQKNYSSACVSAGSIERESKNRESAKKYFEHACTNLHNGRGCAELGKMYETGEVGARDAGQALKLYETACPADKPWPSEGCYSAAVLYEKGADGVPKRPERVGATYARACSSMDPDKTGLPQKACKKAAPLLEKAKKDSDARRVYVTLCAAYKDKAACEHVKKLSAPPIAKK